MIPSQTYRKLSATADKRTNGRTECIGSAIVPPACHKCTTHMRGQTLLPILLPIRHLDKLNIHAISIAFLARLMVRESTFDECLCGIDISRRGRRPDLS